MRNDHTKVRAVFANGIWKSGNHLLLKLCDKLGFPLAGSGIAASSINGNFKFVRKLVRGPLLNHSSVNIGLEQPIQVSNWWLNNQFDKSAGCTIGGHAAYSKDFLEILLRQKVRTILMVRDPRDIVVSYARWIDTRRDEYWQKCLAPLSLEDRMFSIIQGFEGSAGRFDSLATVLDRASGWLHQPEVLVVRFENLVGENGGGTNQAQLNELVRVVNWLGVTDVDIESVQNSLFGGTKTFHSGQVGAWQNSFTPEVLKVFEEVVGQARMQEWSYE